MSDWVNGDGSFGDMAGAPESVSTLASSKGFKSVEALAEGYQKEAAFKGTMRQELNLPETLTDDMVGRMHTKLGRPDTPDGYDFGDTGKTFKPEVLSGIKGLAHAQGLNPAQATAVVNQILEMANVEVASEEAATAAVETALREKHGDKYDAYMKEAFDVSETLGITATLDKYGLNRNPEVIEMLHKMSSKLGEATLQAGGGSVVGAKTVDEQIETLIAQEGFADKMHPKHHDMMVEWHNLLAQKHNVAG
jgi:hypothetical protein